MKENFDDIIRRRWEERPYPVDPEHREEMAKLLDRDKRRKGFPFWWLSGFVVVAAVIVFGLTEVGEHSAEAKEKAKAEAKAEEMTNVEAKANGQLAIDNGQLEKSKEHLAIDNEQLKTSNEQFAINNGQLATSNGQLEIKKQSKSIVKANKEISNSQSTNENPQGSPLVAGGTSPLEAGDISEEVIPPGGFKVELENPGQVRIASEIATVRVFPDSLEYDPWTNAIYRDGTVRSLNITKPVDALALQEVEVNRRTMSDIIPVHRMSHPVYLIGEAGGGMILASKPFYTGGYKVNLGAGIGMRVAPRVHLQLTGGYLMQDGGFDFERSSIVNTPDFGVRSAFNTLTSERLHFAYGKLGMGYRIGKSSINAHLGTQYLYGAQGTISIVQNSQFSTSADVVTTRGWLKTTGLRKWQFFADASYGYMVLPKLYLQGGVGLSLTSLTEVDEIQDGYYWNGKTAKVQPFITLNYLLHGKL